MAMLKLCRCGKPIPLGKHYCPACEAQRAARVTAENRGRYKDYDTNKRDKRSTEFYRSRPWKRTRLAALARDNYLCRACMERDRVTAATVVDHIKPLKLAWEKRLDLDNLQSLCAKCHSIKTVQDLKEIQKQNEKKKF